MGVGWMVLEKLLDADVEETLLQRINVLCKEQVKNSHQKMDDLGAKVQDANGSVVIPQPENDRDKIMFAAGQMSWALIIQGVTS